MDEQKLVAEFLSGEESAFVALYRLHAPSLYAFLRHLLGRWESEADDALQDVWLRAARDLPRFRGLSTFKTWLFGIAVNRSREILRATPNFVEELTEIDGPVVIEPSELRIDLQRAIARLPLRYREVFVLHDLYEHTHAEIGAMLGIDEGTSKSNLSRARAATSIHRRETMTDDRLDLSSVPRELAPPPALDRKIASALRRQGSLRNRRAMFAYLAAAAAAVVIAVTVWQVRPATPSPKYMLLLYESPQFTGGNRAEYGQWARQMQPLIAGGEELSNGDVLAVAGNSTAVPDATPRLAGYFLIDAADDAGAARVARACPHLRHGGAVVLRKIVH